VKYLFQWQRGDKSLIYVVYRWLIAIFFTVSFVNSVIYSIQRHQLALSLIYLTRWNILITAATCILGAYFSTLYYIGKTMDRMTLGLKLYWFSHNNITVFACAISCIYWSTLYDGSDIGLNEVLVHITNSLVLIFDLFIINHPYHLSHFIYPMICGSMYQLFTIVYTFAGGVDSQGNNYIYSILNWKEKPLSSVIVSTLSLICLAILHMIVCGIHAARSKFGECVSKQQCESDGEFSRAKSECMTKV
jgi:hypothetical protein